MGTRKDLATLLAAGLPKTIRIIDHPADIDPLGARVRAAVMLIRQTIEKAPNKQGSFIESFDVWVIEPKIDDNGTSEDSLDESLDLVLVALSASTKSVTWSKATRSKFPKPELPAYKIDAQLITKQ